MFRPNLKLQLLKTKCPINKIILQNNSDDVFVQKTPLENSHATKKIKNKSSEKGFDKSLKRFIRKRGNRLENDSRQENCRRRQRLNKYPQGLEQLHANPERAKSEGQRA